MPYKENATQIISTAFIFGASAIVFATMPFLFVVIRGIIKANQNNHSSSIFNVFGVAFMIHFISCLGFMMAIKILDTLNSMYQQNYLQEKIFGVFWTRGKSEILSMVGSSGSVEDEGAYLVLYIIQVAFDLGILLVPIFLTILAITYGVIQSKRDNYQSNALQTMIWILISIMTTMILFILWAKIATIALFMPHNDIITMIQDSWRNMVREAFT